MRCEHGKTESVPKASAHVDHGLCSGTLTCRCNKTEAQPTVRRQKTYRRQRSSLSVRARLGVLPRETLYYNRSEGFPNGIFHPCTLWDGGLARWKSCRRAVAAVAAVAVGVIWQMPKYEEMYTFSQMGMSNKSRNANFWKKSRRRPNVEQSYLRKSNTSIFFMCIYIHIYWYIYIYTSRKATRVSYEFTLLYRNLKK